MAIEIVCAGCGKRLRLKDELAGRKVKCPTCGAVSQAPVATDAEFAVPPVPPALPPADSVASAAPPAPPAIALAPARRSGRRAWLWGGVAAVVVALGGAVATVFLLMNPGGAKIVASRARIMYLDRNSPNGTTMSATAPGDVMVSLEIRGPIPGQELTTGYDPMLDGEAEDRPHLMVSGKRYDFGMMQMTYDNDDRMERMLLFCGVPEGETDGVLHLGKGQEFPVDLDVPIQEELSF